MTSTIFTPPAAMPVTMHPKQQFLDAFEREHEITLRVLRAYPADKIELKPHAKLRTAREIAFVFVQEMGLAQKALTTGFDWTEPRTPFPPAPETMAAIISAFDAAHQNIVELVKNTPDDRLFTTVKFPSGPGVMADYPTLSFLWFMLSDQIHHRGQLSVYLRLADGKLPSIYGPTLDEPWT